MNNRLDKRQKTVAFGSYPAISLAEARARRDEAKQLLAKDIDPGEHAKRERAQRTLDTNTFGAIAEEL
ncbi:integrase arm-type DNA-binding domain-containing protein [Acuticoccus sp. MNP-M23]|uniref:integrase arm-type DNA-binding domain-containing protein n=1 Tax=Acuticoccus sp. MNP-M23 TaxID=3072793 RepID=UPI00281630D7|nr:integrase arm-type DNA-binding domain-containing protein [Acuticoccus sp. MNP-M23]WMS43769.1 integrase arm-type DNA-binding domain-containing protein [Acuticoccus sp. MNP-M23]